MFSDSWKWTLSGDCFLEKPEYDTVQLVKKKHNDSFNVLTKI